MLISCLSLLINFNNMLGVIDFRNARYQGEIQNELPHGLGILIDRSLLFCLATWSSGNIDGPLFAVYPDYKIFCGYVHNHQLSHLSCFYLPEHIQTYINYRQAQHNNFYTLLPAFKLILQIDCSNPKGPKAVRHINYDEDKANQDQQLLKAFGKQYEMQQYHSWKSFLRKNFLERYQNRLLWHQSIHSKYCQFFLGFKRRGLGIKLLEFFQGELANVKHKTPIIVSSIGQFCLQQELRGYGQRLVDHNLFKLVEEGQFYQKVRDTMQYQSRDRPLSAVKLFNIYQQKSIYFKDKFIDLSLFSKLEIAYSKIDVEVSEETKKIAQVILRSSEDSEMVLAQIEKRGQKRKKSVLLREKKEKSILENSDLKLSGSISNDKVNPTKLTNPQIKLDDALKSIYSSAQKIKREHPERIHKTFQKYQNLFGNEKSKPKTNEEKQPPKPIVSRVNQSPSPKNGIRQQRYKYNLETLDSRLDQPSFRKRRKQNSLQSLENRNDIRQAELALYRKITDLNELKYQDLQSSFYRKNNNENFISPPISQQQGQNQHGPYQRNAYPIVSNSPYHRQNGISEYSSKTRYANQFPLYKTLVKDEDYSIYYQKIKDKQQQLEYYNKALKQSRENDLRPYTQKYAQTRSPSVERSRSRPKTPGKIRTIKRQRQSYYEGY